MKKGIGIKVGVTLALLASFLFATPTQQYQVTAAKEKTEKTTATKRKANKKVTVKVKHYLGVEFVYTNQSSSMHGGGSIG